MDISGGFLPTQCCSIIIPRCAQLRKASPWASSLPLSEAALPSSWRSALEVPVGDAFHLQRLGPNEGTRVPKEILFLVCSRQIDSSTIVSGFGFNKLSNHSTKNDIISHNEVLKGLGVTEGGGAGKAAGLGSAATVDCEEGLVESSHRLNSPNSRLVSSSSTPSSSASSSGDCAGVDLRLQDSKYWLMVSYGKGTYYHVFL